jgi:hypothetical protein
MGKQLKPYVTDDVRIVFHGCDATWQGGYMDAFLLNLPDQAEIYGHAQAAQPGEPFDWVHWYKKADANGKLKAHHDDMGKTPVIDELFPMIYAEWWAETNVYTSYDPNPGITAFQAWTSQPFVKRVPSDIEDLMRQLMKKK